MDPPACILATTGISGAESDTGILAREGKFSIERAWFRTVVKSDLVEGIRRSSVS